MTDEREHAPVELPRNDQSASAIIGVFLVIFAEMRRARWKVSGEGHVLCPVCNRPDGIHYAWRRGDGRLRNRQALRFVCATEKCIRGSGH
jgi:hypothetical protein